MSQTWKVICFLAELFSTNEIKYQFDGSTAVFIHGIEFDMDDIDVCICSDSREKVLFLLRDYESTAIVASGHLEYCYIKIDGVLVHAMFIFNKPEFTEETRDIFYDDIKIHTKNIEFYHRHTKKDNPLIPLIDEWLNRRK